MLIVERPTLIEEKVSDLRSRFTLGPLEPGFGCTLDNSLRYIPLFSIPGAVVTSICIDGVPRESCTTEGMKEDITEITLNIKQIVLSSENDKPIVMHLRKAGPGEVLVGDIAPPAGMEIHNPDLHFATLNEKDKLEIELTVKRGRGYVSVAQSKDPQTEISRTPIDSIHPPVVKVTYKVEATRVQQRTDFDCLVIDVETKSAIAPRDALASTGKTLVELSGLMRELNEGVEGIGVGPSTTDTTSAVDLVLPIKNLNLQSRSYNALCRCDTLTVGELVAHPEVDLLDVRNSGIKSIEEIKEPPAALGTTLKGSVMPSFSSSEFAVIFSDDQSI